MTIKLVGDHVIGLVKHHHKPQVPCLIYIVLLKLCFCLLQPSRERLSWNLVSDRQMVNPLPSQNLKSLLYEYLDLYALRISH